MSAQPPKAATLRLRLIEDFSVAFERMTWPRAMGRTRSIEWTLRYGTPKEIQKARFLAASIVNAYAHLVMDLNAKERAHIIAVLRRAEKEARDA
jgi:hypothetical protein